MILKRVIHPIGQGGFYTETFIGDNGQEVFNAVYDCGSETQKPDLIKEYLKEWIDENPQRRIDAVFISHLHEDHINGLDDLLSTGRVKRVFLPKLTPEVIIEAYLYNYNNTGSLDNKSNLFINKVLQKEYKETRIIQVDEMNSDDNDIGDPVLINEADRDTYPSGSLFFNRFMNRNGELFRWLYIPFNSPLQSKKGKIGNDAFFSSVKDTKGQVDPKKLVELIKTEGIEKCKPIYAEYFGKTRHNSYSMTLFSGIEKPSSIKVYCRAKCMKSNCCCCDCKYHPETKVCSPNFLYTGDFEPNKKNDSSTYEELMEYRLGKLGLWSTIKGIQIPHHGSKANFNVELYRFPCKGYISVGSNNTYHHPNVDTMVGAQEYGCKTIIVSEDPYSVQREFYHFY